MSRFSKGARLLACEQFNFEYVISALLERWTTDDCFGMRMHERALRKITRCCERSHPLETGGILVGQYSTARDCALVSAAGGPPLDSRMGPTWFIRGTRHLQTWLNHRWEHGQEHYLGEWHYHPSSPPNPSGQDRDQMRKIAKSRKIGCPEPLLLIVGGDAKTGYCFNCFVSPRGRPLVPLLPIAKV